MRSTVAFLILATIFTVVPPATARLDVGPLVLVVDDGHYEDCLAGTDDPCVASFQAPKNDSQGSLNADERIYYIGAATNQSYLPVPILPDESIYVRGSDFFVRQPVIPSATEAWGQAPQPNETAWLFGLRLSEDNVTVHYFGPTAHDLSSGAQERDYSVVYNSDTWAGYEREGPYNNGTWTNSNRDLDESYVACWAAQNASPCWTVRNSTVPAAVGHMPNTTVGAGFYDAQLATNASDLGPTNPSSVAHESSVWLSAPLGEIEDESGGVPGVPASKTYPPDEQAPAHDSHGAPRLEPAVIHHPPSPVSEDKRLPPSVPGAVLATGFVLSLVISAFYSRIRSAAEVLTSEERRLLMAIIATDPGVGLSELATAAEMNRTAVVHHLRVLERAGLVRVEQMSRRTNLFPSGVPRSPSAHFERHDVCGPILRVLRSRPEGIPRSQLATIVPDVPARTRNYNVARMIQAGLLLEEGLKNSPILRFANSMGKGGGTGISVTQ